VEDKYRAATEGEMDEMVVCAEKCLKSGWKRGVKVGWVEGEGWHRQCEVLRLSYITKYVNRPFEFIPSRAAKHLSSMHRRLSRPRERCTLHSHQARG
jgi:hypothetical protein